MQICAPKTWQHLSWGLHFVAHHCRHYSFLSCKFLSGPLIGRLHDIQLNLDRCWAFLSEHYASSGSRPKLGWNSLLCTCTRAAHRSKGNRFNPLPPEPECPSGDLSWLLFPACKLCQKWIRMNPMAPLPARPQGTLTSSSLRQQTEALCSLALPTKLET